jgi:hypothetical protein
VGAGYRDAPAVFRRGDPAQDQLAALPRGDEFLVAGVDGGREDERVGVVEVPRGVANDDVAAERSQPRPTVIDSRASQPLTGAPRDRQS